MEKLRPPVLAGYDLAIEKAKHLHKERTGKHHGAVAWLAGKLGVTRQTIDNWSERAGFPEEHVSKVARLLDIPAEIIRPETVLAEMPKTAWETIAKITPKFLIDQAVVYSSKRRRHG
jgi:hypothetical protein